jgi:hypothetical protein
MACVLTIARFVEPQSELHIDDTWYARTALSDMLGVAVEPVNESRLYRTLDEILPRKAAIEQHLKARIGELFSPDFDLLLYDVTSTYFEGLAEQNPQAQRGYSRDHRPDCKQVCIGLVVTRDGFPLGYEVFDGNRTDVTTVQQIVEAMEAKYGRAGRIWVMDRGMVSEENLAFLRSREARYLVGTPRAMLRQFEKHLLQKNWHEVSEGVEVKLVASPDGQETFVLCRSANRQQKEKAMHEHFASRIEAGLARLANSLEAAAKKRGREAVGRQIGRLLEKYRRAAAAFQIDLVEAAEQRSGLKLTWSRRTQWETWAQLSEGCYLLRTNLTGQTPQQLSCYVAELLRRVVLANLHPTDRRRRSLPHRQDRTAHPTHLAPTRAPRTGPHPVFVSRVCPVEDAPGVDATGRPGPRRAHTAGRAGPHQSLRRDPADPDGPRGEALLRHAPRCRWPSLDRAIGIGYPPAAGPAQVGTSPTRTRFAM